MTTYNFCDYYGAMVGQFSTLGNVWKGIIDNQETTVHSVESDRQKEMGVSTDEELADGANWDLVVGSDGNTYNHKEIAIARIISKG